MRIIVNIEDREMSSDLVPVISLWQPWASAIACGAKRIETRSWRTDYRGPILIHAGLKHVDQALWLEVWPYIGGRFHYCNLGEARALVPYGELIAVAELVDCVPTGGGRDQLMAIAQLHDMLESNPQERALGDFTAGRYGWVLANVRALPVPIPYTGRQGLFKVPVDILPAEFRPQSSN